MNRVSGVYQVVGGARYRGHDYGTVFEATMDERAERRAVGRGNIVLLRRFTPSIQPGSFTLPEGWLSGTGPPSLPQQEGS